MRGLRRRLSGRSASLMSVAFWLLAVAAAWRLGAGQVCEDYSVDTGVYW